MKDIIQYIGNEDFWWISVITFLVIILISGFMGALNGWKTATYFLVWNIIAVAIGVFMISTILDKIGKQVDSYNLPININAAVPYVGPLILLVVIFAANILAFIIYWFVRKPLKRSIRKNTKEGKSTVYNRMIGVGVGVIAGLPSAVIMTNYASLATNDSAFTKFNGFLLSGITGTKFRGFDKTDKDSIKSILQLVGDSSKMDEFESLFQDSENIDFSTGKGAKYKDKIEKILANPILLEMFAPTKLEWLKKWIDKGGSDPLKSVTKDLKPKINVPKANTDLIIEKLQSVFPKSTSDELNTLYRRLFQNA